MASGQTFSTADLRSAATENHRVDLDKRRKWAHGKTFGPGRDVDDTMHARPAKPDTRALLRKNRDGLGLATAKARARNIPKKAITEYYDTSDSSVPEDVHEPSAAPEPDAEVAYSFDAARGPSHGSQILGLALVKAVERYEVVATDKLIKDEYEVLDSEGEPIVPKSRGKQKAAHVTVPLTDDDFELI